MRRQTCPLLAAALVVTACSARGPEPIATTTAADSTDPLDVTVTGFDENTRVMTVRVGEEMLALHYTADTDALPTSVPPEPPDPCFGQETAWNQQIGRGLTQAVIERLAHFARFQCEAQVTRGSGDEIAAFQPGRPVFGN